ncbi:SRPBCC family protein [Nocardioides bruguierae]|uniref:SRPBCC family protein n=1 Tax=Nocardioides bruguierae TaxID=2945102 RepID=A0A9X2IE88_9ACTN|nr:SRPBCC family protein [Nocardioides bruguierae]MCL8026472.1 SRPBCC family protein [Nocardioides bruguierae]MCM0619793.1 SRPBCC family protein [Nocardioides bruguierae]
MPHDDDVTGRIHPVPTPAGRGGAERELRVEAVLAAPPDAVWRALTDLRRMPSWSPELVTMLRLRPGGLRAGQQYLCVNRRGPVLWPTRSVVRACRPCRELSWLTTSSGALWVWELAPAGEGTRVVHRRPVPEGTTWLSRAFAPLFLGGNEGHADELESGMARTLAGLRAAVDGPGRS